MRHLRHVLYWLIPCLIYGAAVLHSPHKAGEDLNPQPDAMEYALLASRLAHFEAPLIQVGLWEFPARYPLSYPMLLTPFAWVLNINQLWVASAILGLIATALIVHVGRWLLGSRAAGCLAALFWALHPSTLAHATFNMSEMGLILVFLLMLELARPWIERVEFKYRLPRALLLGLAVGWLAVAKQTFLYWLPALGLLMLLRRRVRDLIAFASIVCACIAAHLLYQRWAFGQWGMNGYKFWYPPIYDQFWITFNPRYALAGWLGMVPPGAPPPPGNLLYYGRAVLGLTHDFYSPYMGVTILVSAVCLLWPSRIGRPFTPAIALLIGWVFVGILFCAFYHFQTVRFAFVWIVLADMLAAWGLVHVPLWSRLRRGRARGFRLKPLAQLAGLAVALLLLRGEYRRDRAMFFESPDREQDSLSKIVPAILKNVPEGDWLISNFDLPLMPYYRPTPGPTAALYSSPVDYVQLNGHVHMIDLFSLKPHRINLGQAKWITPIPDAWRLGSTVLINSQSEWKISAADRKTLFAGKPVWLLIVSPKTNPHSARLMADTIWPMLRREAAITPVAQRENVALYKLQWQNR